MKKWLLSTLAFATIATAAQAAEVNQPYAKLKKQIGIMSNIIESSLSEGKGRNRSEVSVDGVYLKSQGIVFEVNSGRGFARLFSHRGRDMDFDFDMPVPPVAPVVSVGNDDFGRSINEVVSRSMEVYEDAMESMRDRSEHARSLREEQREISYDLRNSARRQRDMEFEARHADGKRSEELKEQMAELKEEIDKLKKKNDELKERAEKEEKSLKQKNAQRIAESKKARQQYYAKLEISIAETLCDYGAGLRQLAKNEHVTFVINMGDSGHNDGEGHAKKIHSFSKKDIVACVMEDKTPAELLKAGNAYFF